MLSFFRIKIFKLYLGNSAQNWNLVDNKLPLQHSKTECILFGSRRKLRKVHNFEIECNGHTINAQSSAKYLGVNLNNFLSEETIANSIIGKVNSRLKFLTGNVHVWMKKTRKSLCSAVIQSHLDYFCLSWYAGLNKTLKKNKTKLFDLLKNLGPRSYIGYSELDSLGFLNVENRVKQLRLNHVFNIFNGTCLSYLSEHFRKVSDFHMYSTRGSSENFVIPRVSGYASTTFFFNGIKVETFNRPL